MEHEVENIAILTNVLDQSVAMIDFSAIILKYLNLSKLFVYGGPLSGCRMLNQIPQIMGTSGVYELSVDLKDVRLARYVEKKIGDFVRVMNMGSGKILYPTLMRAVAQPGEMI